MTYYLVTIQTIVCVTGVIFQIPKWRVPRLLNEELSLQGLLRFIELKTFRSVTGYSISIVNMSKQDDGLITGEILHRLDYPSVYNSQQTDLTEAVILIRDRGAVFFLVGQIEHRRCEISRGETFEIKS